MGVKRRDQYYDEYYALELIDPQSAAIPDHAYHDRFLESNFRGKMALEIQTISELFVGTGEYEIDDQGVYQPFSRSKGRPIIPGTSIKGAVRTYAEALSPSCEGGTCRADQNRVCICCRIFGALGFQGRITFCDAEIPGGAAVEFTKYTMSVRRSDPRHRYERAEERRFYYHNKPDSPRITNPQTDRLFPNEWVEAVPKGTNFTSEFIFENLNNVEMGLLLLALGLSPAHRFNLKLGGGKNRRLGSVRFNVPSGIKLAAGDAYSSISARYDTRHLQDWGKEAIEAYLNLDESPRRMVLENVAAFQADPS